MRWSATTTAAALPGPDLESACPIREGSAVLPSWCRSEPGGGPVLVIAPHGGLCARDLLAPDPPASLRGNDLHTAELARLLSDRLDASLLVNHAADRNEVDLNRLDEVLARAPWFLDAIGGHLERIVARHGRAVVLVVHGWQIVQPRCDLGVGARLATADEAASRASRLTASPEFVAGTLERLRHATAERGMQTTYGLRWPAQHRNNVMQIFRRGVDEGPDVAHRVRALAARGCIDAVQLELGAPLRYPGEWRDRLLEALTAAFTGSAPSRATGRVERHTDADAGSERAQPAGSGRDAARPGVRGVALQAFTEQPGENGLGIVVGLGAMPPRELGARLLLFTGGQRMLLFTGHERIGQGANDRVGGLEARSGATGLTVRFRGPVLDVPDASRHFRVEAAQLDARVVDLELDLRFVPHGESGYGALEGEARAGRMRWPIAAHGFTEPVLARPPGAGRSLRLTASFGGALGITAELATESAAGRLRCLTSQGVREHALAPAVASIVPGRLAKAFEMHAHDGPRVRCTPLGHVSILRPGPGGRPLHVTFGAARFELDGGELGGGFYEHAAPAIAEGAHEGEGE